MRQPEAIRTLAKKSEGEWVNLVKEKHAAGEVKLPFEVGTIAGQPQTTGGGDLREDARSPVPGGLPHGSLRPAGWSGRWETAALTGCATLRS